jgi:hypothetical protein
LKEREKREAEEAAARASGMINPSVAPDVAAAVLKSKPPSSLFPRARFSMLTCCDIPSSVSCL